MKLIDIGANLTDPVFRGKYRGHQAHPDDLAQILERAREAGIVAMMVTGGNLEESRHAIEMCRQHANLYATVGCHPTRTSEVRNHPGGAAAYFAALQTLISENRDKVVAIGECGLDYDRLHFSDKDTQLEHFVRHFELAQATGLPLFLHDRNTQGDFARLMKENRQKFTEGVVHSFTGSVDEAKELLDLGLFIGINGCSLKTEDNLAAVKSIPADRLMIETDCPYCEIRPTHASHKILANAAWKLPESKRKERWTEECLVKSRNEPCTIRQVLHVLAALHGMEEAEMANTLYANTVGVFRGIN
ncbi:hypothetical protein H4S07_001160 [Coemansia furcata]|uniref:Uncharacterized protein n=1 Tax=Coemansia furcata TaxID=417177 RepID=A0ACC1LPG3_9FUNG|nr:hypothetical protein H4S07_001160 [Coemansia furcata]